MKQKANVQESESEPESGSSTSESSDSEDERQRIRRNLRQQKVASKTFFTSIQDDSTDAELDNSQQGEDDEEEDDEEGVTVSVVR